MTDNIPLGLLVTIILAVLVWRDYGHPLRRPIAVALLVGGLFWTVVDAFIDVPWWLGPAGLAIGGWLLYGLCRDALDPPD